MTADITDTTTHLLAQLLGELKRVTFVVTDSIQAPVLIDYATHTVFLRSGASHPEVVNLLRQALANLRGTLDQPEPPRP